MIRRIENQRSDREYRRETLQEHYVKRNTEKVSFHVRHQGIALQASGLQAQEDQCKIKRYKSINETKKNSNPKSCRNRRNIFTSLECHISRFFVILLMPDPQSANYLCLDFGD